MPEISLTDFVDFVVKSGKPKLTKVKQIKERPEYDPATDFWKPLREGIVKIHRTGNFETKEVDKILPEIKDPKKLNRYREAIAGYKKFLGRKKIEWFEPPRNILNLKELGIRINPELGLKIGGERFIIKLYFKNEKLVQNKVDTINAIMEIALRENLNKEDKLAILDVSNSKFFVSNGLVDDLYPLLFGEAVSFVAIWNMLHEK